MGKGFSHADSKAWCHALLLLSLLLALYFFFFLISSFPLSHSKMLDFPSNLLSGELLISLIRWIPNQPHWAILLPSNALPDFNLFVVQSWKTAFPPRARHSFVQSVSCNGWLSKFNDLISTRLQSAKASTFCEIYIKRKGKGNSKGDSFSRQLAAPSEHRWTAFSRQQQYC